MLKVDIPGDDDDDNDAGDGLHGEARQAGDGQGGGEPGQGVMLYSTIEIIIVIILKTICQKLLMKLTIDWEALFGQKGFPPIQNESDTIHQF